MKASTPLNMTVVSGVLLLVALFDVPTAAGQEEFQPVTLPNTEQRILRSSTSGIDYKLYVSIPDGSTTDEGRPVIYVLDADYAFAIARNVVEYLSDRGDLQKALVVGIAYDGPLNYRMNRTRDYTPTNVPEGGYGPEYQAVSGGAAEFLAFIRDDLMSFVSDDYRAGPSYLVGHSFGGLFAIWAALTEPDLFDGFVIVSPSLWYGDGVIFDIEKDAAASTAKGTTRIYMAVGSREVNGQHNMVDDLSRFAAALERRTRSGLELQWEVAANETHNSVFPRALSNGLRFVLDGR